MVTEGLLSAALLLTPPGAPPNHVELPEQICVSLAPGPASVDASYFDGERPDGTSYWGTAVTYELSNGAFGEFHVLVDHEGSGEAYFAVDGQIVAHAAVSVGERGIASAHTWAPTHSVYRAELLAELMQGPIVADVFGNMFTQEFRCSSFGKKAVKGFKYALYAVTGAAVAACCLGAGVGCIACTAGGAAVTEFGGDHFDGYCDQ